MESMIENIDHTWKFFFLSLQCNIRSFCLFLQEKILGIFAQLSSVWKQQIFHGHYLCETVMECVAFSAGSKPLSPFLPLRFPRQWIMVFLLKRGSCQAGSFTDCSPQEAVPFAFSFFLSMCGCLSSNMRSSGHALLLFDGKSTKLLFYAFCFVFWGFFSFFSFFCCQFLLSIEH